eukprot:gene4691-4876_t
MGHHLSKDTDRAPYTVPPWAGNGTFGPNVRFYGHSGKPLAAPPQGRGSPLRCLDGAGAALRVKMMSSGGQPDKFHRKNKYIIQCVETGKNLQCKPDGQVAFLNTNELQWEWWGLQRDAQDKWYIVSFNTAKVLQCDGNGGLKCANMNRLGWEAFSVLTDGAPPPPATSTQPGPGASVSAAAPEPLVPTDSAAFPPNMAYIRNIKTADEAHIMD